MPQVQDSRLSGADGDGGFGQWNPAVPMPPAGGGGAARPPGVAGRYAFDANRGLAVPGQMWGQDSDLFGFLESQVAHIESTAWRTMYADIQYHRLVSVDRSAWDWARTIVHYSMDQQGEAEPMGNRTTDLPLVAQDRTQHSVKVESFWVGYDYSVEELMVAQRIPDIDLLSDKAMIANRVMEELIDDIVLNGRSEYGWDSLLKQATGTGQVPLATAKNGAGGDALWANKTGLEMAEDIQDAIEGVWTTSNTVLMADTVLLPPSAWAIAARTPVSEEFPDKTVIQWVMENNSYTAQTGQPIRLQWVRGLEDAGASGVGRLVAYNRDPNVLRLHCPMSFGFDNPFQPNPYRYVVPGMMRCGGLEIRQPQNIRYIDGILPAA